ncbi:MAG: MIP/aquaporin family protein [Acidobacteriaceae bacterium]
MTRAGGNTANRRRKHQRLEHRAHHHVYQQQRDQGVEQHLRVAASACRDVGYVSAGHGCCRRRRCAAQSNGAVILGMQFTLRRNFPWRRVPGYVLAQMVGGIGAALFRRAMFGTVGALGATVPGRGIDRGQALAMEVVLSAGLVSTILGTASGARNTGSNAAIAVSGYIALAGLWVAPISGVSMNPVRSLAPDLIRGDLSTTWIYVVGPLLGALIGIAFESILKGKPTAAGRVAAEGARGPDD